MNKTQAKRASETLEDVFTAEGDAVVIDRLHTYANVTRAWVTGHNVEPQWIPISELTAVEDL